MHRITTTAILEDEAGGRDAAYDLHLTAATPAEFIRALAAVLNSDWSLMNAAGDTTLRLTIKTTN